MATDLVGNEKLQRFIFLLSELNHKTAEILQSGDVKILAQINPVIEEMYSIQHVGEEDAYTAIEEDMQVIYGNFNAIIAMMDTNESVFIDNATNVAVKKFLRNIFDATVRIVYAYGLA
ncbi:MAG: hypothetical protein IJB97_01790 [Clostridia bacterium]|nr:hypothetical protein [Clostridia bacterium]